MHRGQKSPLGKEPPASCTGWAVTTHDSRLTHQQRVCALVPAKKSEEKAPTQTPAAPGRIRSSKRARPLCREPVPGDPSGCFRLGLVPDLLVRLLSLSLSPVTAVPLPCHTLLLSPPEHSMPMRSALYTSGRPSVVLQSDFFDQ